MVGEEANLPDRLLQQDFAAALACFESLAQTSSGQWWIALSGGRDSVVLLDLLHLWLSGQFAASTSLAGLPRGQTLRRPELRAIHVHHGINPDADRWVALCQQLCDARDIPLTVRHAEVADATGRGIEAAARTARYAEFRSVLAAGDTLMLAHHANDQAETVLFRLLRGSGPKGLAGMPAERGLGAGRLYRPLLAIGREAINQWLHARNLGHVEDSSNSDTGLDRNYLRQTVLPLLEARWPGCLGAINRAAMLQDRVGAQLARLPLPRTRSLFGETGLLLDAQRYPRPGGTDLLADDLHRWLTLDGVLVPSQTRLESFAGQLLTAAEDRNPALHLGDTVLRRWRGAVYRCAPLDGGGAGTESADGPSPATLPAGTDLAGPFGTVIWQPAGTDAGLSVGTVCHLRYRVSGERIIPANGVRRPFGQLCQERNVPPWWRGRLPLLLAAETGEPLFAPALGELQGLIELTKTFESGRVKPVWVPPLGDSSIEQEEPY